MELVVSATCGKAEAGETSEVTGRVAAGRLSGRARRRRYVTSCGWPAPRPEVVTHAPRSAVWPATEAVRRPRPA
jgi:hypothetical protein